ncbi:MAG TPA: cold shock domain-containing protein [Burkholderiaceae bacterium]|nr:cold shock domain-containing protein [Burkholderiaceae bacterium]
MRYQGKLKKWNAERGFGFIVADDGGQDIFVHVSAFPRDGTPPTEGELLSFEVQPDRDGKKKAVRVSRPGAQPPVRPHSPAYTPGYAPAPRAARRMSRAPKENGPGSKLIAVLILAALGWYGYSHYALRAAQLQVQQAMPAAELSVPALAPADFHCDGRKYCSQMTSCAEATRFLNNCPGMEMDGNRDGVPCEQQWCTSPFAK